MTQRKYLIAAEKSLRVGPVEMARLLDTPYNTYKAWKSERNVMPGTAYIAIKFLVDITIDKASIRHISL